MKIELMPRVVEPRFIRKSIGWNWAAEIFPRYICILMDTHFIRVIGRCAALDRGVLHLERFVVGARYLGSSDIHKAIEEKEAWLESAKELMYVALATQSVRHVIE